MMSKANIELLFYYLVNLHFNFFNLKNTNKITEDFYNRNVYYFGYFDEKTAKEKTLQIKQNKTKINN